MSVSLSKKLFSSVFRTLMILFLFNSCQKTVEDLDDNNPPETPVAIGDSTCLFTTINFDDDIDRKYSKHFEMDAEGKPVRCYEIDYQGALLDWEMKFSPGRIDLIHGQWIKLDGNGRVSESYTNGGMHFSSDYHLLKKYSYNSEGYLTRISVITQNPDPGSAQELSASIYNWQDGNLASIEFESDSENTITTFEYDTAVKVSGFMDVLNLDLVMYFQHFLNFGKKSKNLLNMSVAKSKDGSFDFREEFHYSDHKFDSKGNVISFTSTQIFYRDGEITDEFATRHKLTYTCYKP